jgi:hypothetical protein
MTTGSLEHNLRALATDGFRLNLWRTATGFQANVSEAAGRAWTCFSDSDPLLAINGAVRQRLTATPSRNVIGEAEGEMQIDIEDAIAASTPLTASEIEDMLG